MRLRCASLAISHSTIAEMLHDSRARSERSRGVRLPGKRMNQDVGIKIEHPTRNLSDKMSPWI